MKDKVTYFAIIDDFSSEEEPAGVLRRIEHDGGEHDEQFGHDLVWTRSPLLYAFERGDGDNQLVQISAEEAERIVERISRGR